MSINNVNSLLREYKFTYGKNNQKVTSRGNFVDEMQKAEKKQQLVKASTSRWSAGMVISKEEKTRGITYDSSFSNKAKEELTMDEYKQWFRYKVSKMPVSTFMNSTFVSDTLIITDQAFEKMKSDPEWENTVINMIRQHYGTQGLLGSKSIGFQIIGASPEQCYGVGIPLKNGSLLSTSNRKSWWKKRHDRTEELIEEQVKKAQNRKVERWQVYPSGLMENQHPVKAKAYEKAISSYGNRMNKG
ncbi:MAG: hypothetical protein GX288_11910 [Clostridiales bacterium]|nr:hypothetical protein [Clostridiales bacterium]